MPEVTQLAEFSLIQRIAKRFGELRNQTLVGIGDDCAITQPNSKNLQLITTDLLVEGVHFNRHFTNSRDIGYKAMVANLSDIAAMGGTPLQFLTSIAIPPSFTRKDVDALYEGIMKPAKASGVALIGGDTSSSPKKLFLSLTLIGKVKPSHVIHRTGLQVGDEIFVTGTLGDSNAGLRILKTPPHKHIPRASLTWLSQRHLRPTARLRAGQLLAKHKIATAMIDLSDGLSGDLARICELNSVGATVNITHLPISKALCTYAHYIGKQAYKIALQGGEDYELLFTVRPESLPRIKRWKTQGLLDATHIGTITPKRKGIQIITPAGLLQPMRIKSYDHFQRRQH
tara:strand:- start:5297 stop:6322 length:1026 start_codon:yes stop_codon:yes gene_type:complete